ncbi:Hsp70 family protein [Streptomyces sp. M19]
MRDASDSAHWMVFDLGGGTFDAAVMSKRDGELHLLQHAGDPYLGGKLIDWAIVEDLLAPPSGATWGWRTSPGATRAGGPTSPSSAGGGGRQDPAVPAALGLPQLRSRRRQRALQPFEYTLTRGAVDDLALPFYTRAVRLCRDALAESSLGPDRVDRLLLVGGATLAPGLRELLADPVRGPASLDHSQDPTTVVARGAAVFARTVRLPSRPRGGARRVHGGTPLRDADVGDHRQPGLRQVEQRRPGRLDGVRDRPEQPGAARPSTGRGPPSARTARSTPR